MYIFSHWTWILVANVGLFLCVEGFCGVVLLDVLVRICCQKSFV